MANPRMPHGHKPHFISLPRAMSVVLLSLALAACGGGGGSTPSTPPTTPPPAVSAPALQNATAQTYTVGTPIASLSFTNSGGGSLTGCTVSPALPAGLTLARSANQSTCMISGTPTAVKARTTYTITAINATGTNAATVVITVNAAPRASNLQDIAAVQTYTIGTAITTLGFINTGGAITGCTVSPALPTGLAVTVNAGTCRITGNPTVAKAYDDYTITGSNAAPTNSTATVTIAVNATLAVPHLQNITAPQIYTVGTTITTLIFGNMGGDSLTGCSVSPALPTGLTVARSVRPPNATCTISGNPMAGQPRTLHIITATNATGSDDARVFITVTALAVFGQITFDRVPAVIQNTPGCATQALPSLCHAKTIQLAVKGASVELLDGSGTVMDNTQTDNNGNYRFNAVPDEPVRVRVRAELLQTASTGRPGWHVIVQDNTSEDALYTLAETSGALPSVTADRNLHAASGWNGSTYDTNTRNSGPFAILDTIYKAITGIVAVDPDVSFSKLTVNWSVNNRPTEGDLTMGEIRSAHYLKRNLYLNGAETTNTDEFDQHVIVHEWGHFFEDTLSRSDSIGGSHRLSDSLDMAVAFDEGFGNALAGMVLDDPLIIDTFGQTEGGFSINLENNTHTNPGWYSEGSVQSILYDLYDSADDGNDQITLGGAFLYNVMIDEQRTTPFATSIFTFITALKADLPAEVSNINRLVNAQMINGTNIDATGSRETNNGPPVPLPPAPQPADLNRNDHVLPIYTRITVDAPAKTLCTTTGFDPDSDNNKLSSVRYILFTTGAATDYQITATRTSTTYASAAPSDLVFGIISPRLGDLMPFNPTTGTEVKQLTPSTPYVVGFIDLAVNADTLQGRACFDIQITAN